MRVPSSPLREKISNTLTILTTQNKQRRWTEPNTERLHFLARKHIPLLNKKVFPRPAFEKKAEKNQQNQKSQKRGTTSDTRTKVAQSKDARETKTSNRSQRTKGKRKKNIKLLNSSGNKCDSDEQ